MEYNKLVAVSGLSGLFEVINSKNDGAIIRSLVDKTTRFASSRIHQFSHLESIEIYTTGENVNLVDVFKAMESSGIALPDGKNDKAIKAYFEKAYPTMDFERVYGSDMKKMIKWFEILKQNDITLELTEPASEEAEETPLEVVVEDTKTTTETTVAPKAAKAPAKKAAAKKKTKE